MHRPGYRLRGTLSLGGFCRWGALKYLQFKPNHGEAVSAFVLKVSAIYVCPMTAAQHAIHHCLVLSLIEVWRV